MNKAQVRILYLVGGEGNAERVDVSDLFADKLSKMGFDVDYVIFDLHPSPAWRVEEWRGARAYVVGRSRKHGLLGSIINKIYEVMADLRTFWMALTGKYDVIQIRDKFVVGVLGLLAARIRGIKYVYWLSYPYAECRVLDAKEGRARIPLISLIGGKLAGWLLYKLIMPNSDHVFVQSDQMLNDIAEEGVSRKLMSPVPMAVNENLLIKEEKPVTPNTILYLGTLIRVRRLNVLIEALKIVLEKNEDARLIFVGEGVVPEDREFLEKTAEDLGVSDSVEFTGMVSMEEAHDWVQRSAVCVSPFYPTPILLSTSPTKLIEYMALGRPVVANNHPEQSKIISESDAGICVDWSAKEFANAISILLDDSQAAEQKGEKGLEYVKNNRTYPIIAKNLVSSYDQILGGILNTENQ